MIIMIIIKSKLAEWVIYLFRHENSQTWRFDPAAGGKI